METSEQAVRIILVIFMRRNMLSNFLKNAASSYGPFLPTILSNLVREELGIADSPQARQMLQKVQVADLTLVQTSPIDFNDSDHKGFKVLDSHGKVLVESKNVTMYGKKTKAGIIPNGFGQEETRQRYQARYTACAKKFRHRTHEISLQEAVIRPEDKAAFFGTMGVSIEAVDHSEYGLVRIPAKNNAFYVDTTIMDEIEKHPLLKGGRVLVTRSSDTSYRVHVHMPFKQTKEAFSELVALILKHASQHIDAETLPNVTIDITGDKNLTPSQQRNLTKHAYDQSKRDFSVKSYVLPSPAGHLKLDNGKRYLVTVDSFHRLILSAAEKPTFTHADQESAKKQYGYFVTMLLGGSMLAVNVLQDDLAEIAVVAIAKNAAGLFHKQPALKEKGLIDENHLSHPFRPR